MFPGLHCSGKRSSCCISYLYNSPVYSQCTDCGIVNLDPAFRNTEFIKYQGGNVFRRVPVFRFPGSRSRDIPFSGDIRQTGIALSAVRRAGIVNFGNLELIDDDAFVRHKFQRFQISEIRIHRKVVATLDRCSFLESIYHVFDIRVVRQYKGRFIQLQESVRGMIKLNPVLRRA